MSEIKHIKLKCINCNAEYDAKRIIYSCEKCGDLLEVSHNLDLLKIHRAKDWRDIFDKRLGSQKFPFGSGVWRFFELILPDLPFDKIISLYEGDTNLAYSKKLNELYDAKYLHIKLEGENPTLSFKDRGMTAGVSWANFLGVKAVACASTGDTSAAMAAYAANSNMKGIVLMPENKVSFEQLSQPISYGALTLALKTDFDGCMKLVKELCKRNDIYLLNSMNSFRIEGQKAIMFELIQQLEWNVPDWVVVPVGNAGNISALGKALKEFYELGIITKIPRLAGIQIENANPLYNSYKNNWAELEPVKAKETFASAIRIGEPVSFKKAVSVLKWTNGVVEQVSEQELMDAMVEVDKCGISICPNSGTAVAGYKKLRAKNIIKKEDLVVIISTAHGLKFSQLKINYHQKKYKEILTDKANQPISLEPTIEAIEKIINS
ncbi:MAG TPA: threonine synthase [bacterium]|nr:threonine synthase [bacterium]HOL46811.1 threonine synthase [bacterium]HPQ18663.1 threonine synthase [bacterium]